MKKKTVVSQRIFKGSVGMCSSTEFFYVSWYNSCISFLFFSGDGNSAPSPDVTSTSTSLHVSGDAANTGCPQTSTANGIPLPFLELEGCFEFHPTSDRGRQDCAPNHAHVT
jgi:hypothetical protein